MFNKYQIWPLSGGLGWRSARAAYAACEPIVTTNVFPTRNGIQNRAHMTCSENIVFALRCMGNS